MANMETFAKALMASESVLSYLGTTKFQEADNGGYKYAVVHDGALVKLGGLAPNPAYGDGMLDDNTFLSTAPANATDDVVIVDLAEVSNGVIADNTYKIGVKQVGLKMLAGFPARYRIPMIGDKYWLSSDCFAGTPEAGKYAIPTAGSTKHTVVDDLPTSGKYCIAILDSRDFVVGNESAGSLFFCHRIEVGEAAADGGDGNGTATPPTTYKLAVTATECTVVVAGADSNPITPGDDALEAGDVITITATANQDHTMESLTVNGSAFTSGETHTVSGDVTIVGSATYDG